ncbi:MAG: LLM class flavin-dependent oxidoreductase [Actinobacteria bacterium]|nr:LLM class flavin-dependent oxidoreductase [Actinomycetota bacterium]
MRVHWFLPTGGDARDVLPTAPDAHPRAPDHGYLAQVAMACDRLGYDAMLTPCGTGCEDAWLATASLIPLTRRIRFLVAFRPALLTPTLAAQMASTHQRLSGGRMLVNIVTGAEAAELARFGVHDDKDTRYAQTAEFLQVMRGAWSREPFDFDGRFYRVAGATTREVPDPVPEIYFGGASDAAERVAAEHVDVYLAWGEPPAMVRERVQRVRSLAAAAGRTLRLGIRFHVIARPTAAEAWAFADRLLTGMDAEAIAAAQHDFAATQSVGQRRMAELHGGDPGRLVVHPNVWAGFGLVRGGVGTGLVGSYEEVAERIAEYHDLGFEELILSGYPHLEEAYWFGEGVMPILREAGLLPPLDAPGSPVFSFR